MTFRLAEPLPQFLDLAPQAVRVQARQPGRPAGRLLRGHLQRQHRSVPPHAQRYGPPRRRLLDDARQLTRAAHALAVELYDDVPRLDARGVGGAVGAHVHDHRARCRGEVLDVPHRDADSAACPAEFDAALDHAFDRLRCGLCRALQPRRRRLGGQCGQCRRAPDQALGAGLRGHVDVLPWLPGATRGSGSVAPFCLLRRRRDANGRRQPEEMNARDLCGRAAGGPVALPEGRWPFAHAPRPARRTIRHGFHFLVQCSSVCT